MAGAGNRKASSFEGTGIKHKDLIGIPWRVALALQQDGWWLRSEITWCLSGGTRLYARTQKGEMPVTLKDLVRLDPSTVQLWNGERWTQVVGWHEVPRPAQTYEIELRSGERIGCTGEHLWPTQRGVLPAAMLQVGDVIPFTRLPEPEKPRTPAALDDEMVGWFVGLYIAEGCRDAKAIHIASHQKETQRFLLLAEIAEAYHGSTTIRPAPGNGCTADVRGPVLQGILDAYVVGEGSASKHLHSRAWQRSDRFLRALLMGYLEADGHFDAGNNRWRLGFTKNDALAADLRTICARLGVSIRLRRHLHQFGGKHWPGYRGEIRLERSAHHANKQDGEIIAIRASRARKFWDVEVADEPHLFALASGVLTHNCKRAPMPESVTDRPTSATEKIFLLAKSERYYYDADAVREAQSEDSGWARQRANGVNTWEYNNTPERIAVTGQRIEASTFGNPAGRNQRNYWLLGPEPFSGWTQTSGNGHAAGDGSSGGTTRIASPDCPVHEDRPAQASSDACGEREGDSPTRTGRSDSRHAPELLDDSVSTGQRLDAATAGESSDSLDLAGSPTASAHSTGNRKTPSPTGARDTGGEQSASRIEGNQPSHELPGFGDYESREASKTSARSPRTCTCSWVKDTKETSHFATFPTEIPRRAILAGTSERGCCADCGAPWARVVERGESSWERRKADGDPIRYGLQPPAQLNRSFSDKVARAAGGLGVPATATTTGWRPTCAHEAPTVPATVLDPFVGSGTTCFVATSLGRRSIGIDLNAEYLELAVERNLQMALL